jgi:TIR domain
MPFEYSSFISWAHARRPLGNAFVESLHRALSQEIELYAEAPVYLDRERVTTGNRVDPALASAICRSATWVIVFTPRYLKQEFCRREMAAMEMLEQRRREALGRHLRREDGLIIPVIFRGHDLIPNQLAARDPLDLSRFSTAYPKIAEDLAYAEEIKRIAAYIARMTELEADGAHDCGTFELPEAPPAPDVPPLEFPGRRAAG